MTKKLDDMVILVLNSYLKYYTVRSTYNIENIQRNLEK